jgi:hypothetical protein
MFTFPVGHHKKPGGGSPGNVTGLIHWVKADVGVSTSGSDVTSWADQSGNATNWTTDGAGRVQLIASAQNGLPVVRASSTVNANHLKQTPFFSGTTQQAEFFVMIKSVQSTNYAWGGFGTNPDSVSSHYTFGGAIYEHFGNSARQGGFGGLGGADLAYGIYNVSVGPTGANNYILRVNNTVVGTTTSNIAWDTTFYLFTGQQTINSTAFQFLGDIGELLIYGNVLSSGDRTTVFNYLKARWNTP